MIVLDVSGSTGGSDPGRQSDQAVLAVCDWLDENSRNRDDRIGLIRFASTADTIPTTRAAGARQTFETVLDDETNLGGGTSLAPAVDQIVTAFRGRDDRRARS
jgi:hypothetical protein